jgi:hypothetical protein
MEAAVREGNEELDRANREEEFAQAWREPAGSERVGILELVEDEGEDEAFSAEDEGDQEGMDLDESEEAAIRF